MRKVSFFAEFDPYGYLLPEYLLWRCWLDGRKGIRSVKNGGKVGGGHWLVQIEWRPAGWSVCLPLLIFPCTIKSRSSLLAPAHPGDPGKRAVKWLCLWISRQFTKFAATFTRCLFPEFHSKIGHICQKWTLKTTGEGLLPAGCRSCHPANIVRVLKGTQNVHSSQERSLTGLILSQWGNERSTLYMAVWCHYQQRRSLPHGEET